MRGLREIAEFLSQALIQNQMWTMSAIRGHEERLHKRDEAPVTFAERRGPCGGERLSEFHIQDPTIQKSGNFFFESVNLPTLKSPQCENHDGKNRENTDRDRARIVVREKNCDREQRARPGANFCQKKW